MARRDDDSHDDLPARTSNRRNPVGLFILAGVSAGLVAALAGGAIWWAGRQPSERELQRREEAAQFEKYKNSPLNQAFMKSLKKAEEDRDKPFPDEN